MPKKAMARGGTLLLVVYAKLLRIVKKMLCNKFKTSGGRRECLNGLLA